MEGGHVLIFQGRRRTLIVKVGVGGRTPSNPFIFKVPYLTASTDSVTTLQSESAAFIFIVAHLLLCTDALPD